MMLEEKTNWTGQRQKLLSHPSVFAVYLFHHFNVHITFAVAREVKMFASSLYVVIHITTVLGEYLPHCLAGLAMYCWKHRITPQVIA